MKIFLRKYGYKIIAWIVFALSVLYLYQRYATLENSLDFIAVFHSLNHFSFLIILFAVVLLFANWGIEAIKWQQVNKPIEKVTYLLSLTSVFMGVAVSTVFPNRTGEFLGKILILKKENRIKGVFSSLLSSLSQFSITLLAGLWALFVLKSFGQISVVYVMALTCLALLLLIFYKPIGRLLQQYFPAKWKQFIDFVTYYSSGDIILLLLLSALRYGVFTFQLFLLMIAFGGHVSFFEFLPLSALSFTLTTAIPTTSLSELFVRSNVGLVVFSSHSLSDSTIILSYLSLWVINILLPSLIGFYFGLRKKWV